MSEPTPQIAVKIVAEKKSSLSRIRGWIWEAAKNFSILAGLITAVLFLFPPVYRFSLGLLPADYYKIGSFGDPNDSFRSLPSENVDLASIDDVARDKRIDTLLTERDQIARLGKDKYIPGRNDPRRAGSEVPGRTWDNGKCLFIRDYVLQVETREASLIGDPNGRFRVEKPEKIIMGHRGHKAIEPDLAYQPVLDTSSEPVHPAVDPHTHHFVWDVMAASSTAIGHHFGAHPGDGYVEAVLQALVDRHELSATNSKTGNICTEEVSGPRTKICPRIALWAHGAVAPCTIRPF